MRRSDRLFDILQMLRVASKPTTAATMAERLEVTVRTVYRDIATLQARRIPIEGATGIGYVLRPGFDLPPLMFTLDEIDAIAVGARMVCRLRDAGLKSAAMSVLEKVTTSIPDVLRSAITEPSFLVSSGEAAIPAGVELSELRRAIRETRKMWIEYEDVESRKSRRTIWPIAMAYYVDVTVLGAWCELRNDFRHFRIERIVSSAVLPDLIPREGRELADRWFALQRGRMTSV